MMPIPTITVCPVCKDPKPSEAAHFMQELMVDSPSPQFPGVLVDRKP